MSKDFKKFMYAKLKKLSENPILMPVNIYYFTQIQPILVSFRSIIKHFKTKINNNLNKNNCLSNTIFFEVTNFCNANCIFCAKSKIKVQKKFKTMPFEIFKKAIDDFSKIKQSKNIEVNFTASNCECLLDKNLFEKINYAKSLGTKISLTTNGYLLDFKNNYKKLIYYNVNNIGISIADLDPVYESKVFRVPIKLAEKNKRYIKINRIG